MALGYPHPDYLLSQLTSRQLAEWMAFATMEVVGEKPPPDPEAAKRNKNKAIRDKFEGGMRSLMNRGNDG